MVLKLILHQTNLQHGAGMHGGRIEGQLGRLQITIHTIYSKNL